MTAKIITAKSYNSNPENESMYCFSPYSTKRQTGYVVIHNDGMRKWFPNIQQARTDAKNPDLWPERGEIICPPQNEPGNDPADR
jgi:hypothetical protein